MKFASGRIPLRWRVFLATSITITGLFALAGWAMQQYVIAQADASVRTEIRASIQAYQSVWKARTQVIAAITELMGTMSDVRAAFMTRDQETIRDSAQELWSRVSDQSAVFLVLDPEGHLICSLGKNSGELPVATIPLHQVTAKFPKQLAGYLRVNRHLFYVVLTPVYVQGGSEPLLLNVLCAGFIIDGRVTQELKRMAPRSDFAFIGGDRVFASTLPGAKLPAAPDRYLVSHQALTDVLDQPVAELQVLYSYEGVSDSLRRLNGIIALSWCLTVLAALLISSYTTRRLLAPVKLLDSAAIQVAAGNYHCRIPEQGSDELARLASTFNKMCESIEQARAELIRQEQIQTIGRLGTSLVHDLRNPLAAIYGGAEMLVDGHLPPEHVSRIATNIYRASQRLQELLRDLLNVSRGQKGTLERCRLHDIVEAAAEAVSGSDRDVKVLIEVPECVEVVADRARAERVFFNLFSNAIDVMPEGGQIRVCIEEKTDAIDVLVQDTGPGIPAAVRSEMFRPFVTGKRSGLGLGLTLSRQTMLDMGGDLSVMDGAGGASFRVRFPRAAADETKTQSDLHLAGQTQSLQ
ncbi:MAG: integral rane sensor signal transduction histidine kinase [Bryobacterales bacterium]|nr:integral rane sensor signal transduction histidine kinase [Bryobacterales bacterium]